jgi:hypothetical protein
MSRIPFTVYDIFAYLSSGSVLVAVVDYLYGEQWLFEKEQTAIFALFLLFITYIAGHIIAHFSSLILEYFFVGRVLLRPTEILMGRKRPLLPLLFRLYYKSLPEETQERVKYKAKVRGFVGSGEALFIHVFGVVKQEPSTKERVETFRNLYGFSRNLTFAFLLVGILLLIGSTDGRPVLPRAWALVSLGCSIAMLYRYLKFFRQYSYEILITYAELPLPGGLSK